MSPSSVLIFFEVKSIILRKYSEVKTLKCCDRTLDFLDFFSNIFIIYLGEGMKKKNGSNIVYIFLIREIVRDYDHDSVSFFIFSARNHKAALFRGRCLYAATKNLR